MDIYRLILKSAADGFKNHRGEEMSFRELNEKFGTQKSKKAPK